MIKEYVISFKNDDEEYSTSIRNIKNLCKKYLEKEISQVFYKTYKNVNGSYEEQDCVLLYCEFQKINKGIKFKEVLRK